MKNIRKSLYFSLRQRSTILGEKENSGHETTRHSYFFLRTSYLRAGARGFCRERNAAHPLRQRLHHAHIRPGAVSTLDGGGVCPRLACPPVGERRGERRLALRRRLPGRLGRQEGMVERRRRVHRRRRQRQPVASRQRDQQLIRELVVRDCAAIRQRVCRRRSANLRRHPHPGADCLPQPRQQRLRDDGACLQIGA